LKVYPVHEDGSFGEAFSLTGAQPSSEVSAAAMSRTGDRWLVAWGGQAALFQDGKARNIPAPGWLVASAAFAGDDLLVSVLPIKAAPGPAGGRQKLAALPVVLHLDSNQGWVPVIERPFEKRKATGSSRDPMDQMFAEHTTRVLPDGRKLWALWPFSYVLKRYSPSGHPEMEVVVGEGEPKFTDGQAEQKKLEEKLKREGYDTQEAQFGAFTGKRMLQGAALGRDGHLYLVVSPEAAGDSFALDRLDIATGVVERAPLQMSAGSELTLAAGRDALYLATTNGSGGRWKIDWNALEKIAWKKVAGVKLNGAEVEPLSAGKKEPAKPTS
jgi:hypothetical protein